jgi:hypothetical protein
MWPQERFGRRALANAMKFENNLPPMNGCG